MRNFGRCRGVDPIDQLNNAILQPLEDNARSSLWIVVAVVLPSLYSPSFMFRRRMRVQYTGIYLMLVRVYGNEIHVYATEAVRARV
jgi:hypothetical protein